jgi:hypothetical protein
MPDIHDRYAGVGGCYVINKKGERVPEDVEPVTEPEPVAPIEAQADADS